MRKILAYFFFCLFASVPGVTQHGMLLASSGYSWGDHPNAVIVLDAGVGVFGFLGTDAYRWTDQASGAVFGDYVGAESVPGYSRFERNGQPAVLNSVHKPRHCNNCYYSIDTTSTIVVVLDWKGATSGRTYEYLMDAWPDRGNYVRLENNGIDELVIRGVNRGTISNGFYYWRADISGTSSNSYIYENGSLVATGTANGDTTFGGNTGGTGTAQPGVSILGFNPLNVFANVTGDLYFFAIFSPALNAADTERLDQYINSRFGL